ncbi:Sortase system response regulator [Trema orientale]|uniref:Sortase system response regulator n=1 Tax=Trema orientale TaxID=63057 RepID=A0A2P5EI33_TREOI|nr:Sortase system response regulator [Trema orientale]
MTTKRPASTRVLKPFRIAQYITVLVVDADPTSLANISTLLTTYGYKVMTAQSAVDALNTVLEKETEIDLILTEEFLPDLDKYLFLERLRQVSNLPIVTMTNDHDEIAMLGSLFKGVLYRIVKPVKYIDIHYLWEFASMSTRRYLILAHFEEGMSKSPEKNALDLVLEVEEADDRVCSMNREEKSTQPSAK